MPRNKVGKVGGANTQTCISYSGQNCTNEAGDVKKKNFQTAETSGVSRNIVRNVDDTNDQKAFGKTDGINECGDVKGESKQLTLTAMNENASQDDSSQGERNTRATGTTQTQTNEARAARRDLPTGEPSRSGSHDMEQVTNLLNEQVISSEEAEAEIVTHKESYAEDPAEKPVLKPSASTAPSRPTENKKPRDLFYNMKVKLSKVITGDRLENFKESLNAAEYMNYTDEYLQQDKSLMSVFKTLEKLNTFTRSNVALLLEVCEPHIEDGKECWWKKVHDLLDSYRKDCA